jgi:non-ribosomal peptide synthetase component E (peptide arylation enzyme)
VEFVDYLAIHAAATPDKTALVDGERSINFHDLNRRANQA